MAIQSNPTRINLLQSKAQLRLARQGVDLLTRKKEALLQDFFTIIHTLYQQRVELRELLLAESDRLILSEAVHGTEAVMQAALTTEQDPGISLSKKSVWGVETFALDHRFTPRNTLERGYNPRHIDSSVDRTAGGFEEIIEVILRIIPNQNMLEMIGEEIKKTNMKINSLQEKVVPELDRTIRSISATLQEREREDVFRLKKIKKKRYSS